MRKQSNTIPADDNELVASLVEYLNKIQADKRINSEDRLEMMVEVSEHYSCDGNLLHILGYRPIDVSQREVLGAIATVSVKPDFVLRVNNQVVAVIDIKEPTANLDDRKHAKQILNYLEISPVTCCLGILFNGFGIRVFANMRLPQL